MKIMKYLNLFALLLFATASPVFAAGGLPEVNTFMDNLSGILKGAGAATVTVAIMWSGYKILFTEANIMEVGKIVIGGLFVGGASGIAGYLVG